MSAGGLLGLLVTIYCWLIIFRALASWMRPHPRHILLRWLHMVTEPVLFPLRRLIPPQKLGGLDLSPLIAVLLLQYLAGLLGRL